MQPCRVCRAIACRLYGTGHATKIFTTQFYVTAWGQKTATSCKCLWLQDFSHRALLGFRPTSIALPLHKGGTERITGEFMAGCLPQRAGLVE